MSQNGQSSAVFIFRRDLRLEDNTGLLAACEKYDQVIPLFCFDPRQADKDNNEYFSENAFRFMCDSLLEVNRHLEKRGSRLHVIANKPSKALKKLLADKDITAVYCNADYTPFSRKRDKQMKAICESQNVAFRRLHDICLTKPGSVLTNQGDPYRVYTPFADKARTQPIDKPRRNNFRNVTCVQADYIHDTGTIKDYRPAGGKQIAQQGGRANATKKLRQIEKHANYDEDREVPAIEGTTRLSAHLKFGTISPREFYWTARKAFGVDHGLITELYWRDFYQHVIYHFPDVLGESFNDQFDDLPWRHNKDDFTRWKEGRTGFPIVDAGMRELNKIGWMHNRVRMIVASFQTKDLHIDWRWGEKYFAQNLVDYDPASNNGGWQWAASTGADAQPYFRIFNPWTQGKDYDPECEYIKEYVPELKDVDPSRIHAIEDNGVPDGVDYPEPMVDHSKMYHKTKDWFKKHKK
jgi:deoxyribodipyrimidine photo-lyase